ncbi:uncharacterized protein BDW47DRAFT_132606 [Aspergillus candidus]|uniref:Uncharacterized protein n=1 Tax=Aspergillus candidus TaxID=41067 RepID=A0A2I2F859_ASPCN|nr:hypothetical protein BDW47DRAFT_132606 [Aspergillus candidus]PLB36805.1 hypothetical protein BDW47DRAFT_132606 [Aspergillus candidus]
MGPAAESLRQQWQEPSDVFTILLIIGGDIVHRALGAVSGGTLTPVAFSYGWVAYAMSALLSTAGEARLLPPSPVPDLAVINLSSGYRRTNRSWTIGRLFETYDSWMPPPVRDRIAHPVLPPPPSTTADEEVQHHPPAPPAAAAVPLCVAVYTWAVPRLQPGRTGRDWVWWTGLVTTAAQLGLSVVPFATAADWRVFLLTAGGTALAYAQGALPQWRREKWACRAGNSAKHVALTLGNGSQHVVVVLGHERGLDLEDLAGGQVRGRSARGTGLVMAALAVLWFLLLVTSTGIETHTWYLLGVGALGLLQNLVVAGAPRAPAMLGVPIELATTRLPGGGGEPAPMVFAGMKVMFTLMELEMAYPGFGKGLLGEFFPGQLRPWETEWWASSDVERRRELLREARLQESLRMMKPGRGS